MNRSLDVGITARPLDLPESVSEQQLMRDPFVLVVPRAYLDQASTSIHKMACLPFLRYDRNQLIGRQIATHLTRLKLHPLGKVELDSNQAIFGLIAAGAGWTISTPLGFQRARQFQGLIDIYPLPFASFCRTISLCHGDDWAAETAAVIASIPRGILQTEIILPGIKGLPWLNDLFVIA